MSRQPRHLDGGLTSSARLIGLRLALGGIGYRRGTAAIVLALAVVAATAAVVAPLYSRAAEESIARTALSRSDRFARAVHADVSYNAARGSLPPSGTIDSLQRRLTAPIFGTPVLSFLTSGVVQPQAGPQAGGHVEVPLLERVGLCEHLQVTDGRCATAPTEAVMTARSAQLLGLRIGETFDEPLTDIQDASGAQKVAYLTLVGTTEPFSLDDDFWGGREIFRYYPRERPQGLGSLPPIADSVLLGAGSAKALGMIAYSVDVPTDGGRIGLDDGPAAAKTVTTARDDLSKVGVTVTSQLPALIESSTRRSDVVRVAAPLAAFQLVLLAWVILAHVVSAATQERAPELGLAKLRGLTPARTVRFGLAEVVVLLLVSAPAGTALGWWLVHEVAVHLLAPDISLRISGWVVASVLVGVLGGIGAAAVAARGVARGHVAELLRRVPGSRSARGAGAIEGAVFALVVAGIVQLAVAPGSTPGPVASAGPGMIAIGGALVAARALRLISSRRVARALDRGRPASLVGWAGVARRSGTARTTGVLAAAICLLLIGVQAWTVAARERDARALAETGAAVVLDVQAPSALALVDAVRSADDSGSYAMAAMQLPGSNAASRAIAVDGTRAAAVLGFAGRGPGHVDETLRPALVAPIVLQPGRIAATVATKSVDSPSPLALSATIERADGWSEIPLGDLRPGTRTYSGAIPAACGAGCRFVGLAVSHPGLDIETGKAELTITALASGPSSGALSPLDGQFARRDAWRAGIVDAGGARATLTPGPGLAVQVATPVGFPARILHGDAPDPVPALVGSQVAARDGRVTLSGPDGVPLRVSPAGRAPFIPSLGGSGALVDLELVLRGISASQPNGLQVWLSSDDPAAERGLRAALAKESVHVTARTSAADARAVLDKEGAVLALLLFLACGAVALLVAIGSMLVSAFVGARQRAAEVAALRATGVGTGVLRRALLLENVAGVGVALGGAVLAAAVAVWVVLPVLPLADETSAVLVPRTYPDLVAFGWSVAGVAALLAALAVAIAVHQQRSGTADRMREGAR